MELILIEAKRQIELRSRYFRSGTGKVATINLPAVLRKGLNYENKHNNSRTDYSRANINHFLLFLVASKNRGYDLSERV
jgi:hypothetical protein